ncbi:MAG: hypothetical protein OXB96_01930 [Candidatus Kaiserbacteria bacterium]|nr:hypothetical protein [Candidatus Kaiserbacteria bacterium]
MTLTSPAFCSISLTKDDISLAAEIFAGSYGEESRHFSVAEVKPYFEKTVLSIENNVLEGNAHLFEDVPQIFDEEFGSSVSSMGSPFVPYSNHAMHVLWFIWAHRSSNVIASVAIESPDTMHGGYSIFDEAFMTLIILKNFHMNFLPVDFYRHNGLKLMVKPQPLHLRANGNGNELGLSITQEHTQGLATKLQQSLPASKRAPRKGSPDNHCHAIQQSNHSDYSDKTISAISVSHRIAADSHREEKGLVRSKGILFLAESMQVLAILSSFLAATTFAVLIFSMGYAAYGFFSSVKK